MQDDKSFSAGARKEFIFPAQHCSAGRQTLLDMHLSILLGNLLSALSDNTTREAVANARAM